MASEDAKSSTTEPETKTDTKAEAKATESPNQPTKCTLMSTSCPLVVMIGIGKFVTIADLVGVSRDYSNVLFSLNYTRGYHCVYYTPKNELKWINKRIGHNKDLSSKNFKTKWSKNEIIQFIKDVKNLLINYEKDDDKYYDGLLFFVSTHGDIDNIILTSDEEELNLNEYIIEPFDNSNCQQLVCKPKLFICDCCRGQLRLPKSYNSQGLLFKNEQETEETKSANELEKGAISAMTGPLTTASPDSQDTQNSQNANTAHKLGDIRLIFGNPSGFVVADGGVRGGYLIRCITKVLMNDEWFINYTFNEMIMSTRLVLREYLNYEKSDTATAQVIDDINYFKYYLKFAENVNGLPELCTIKHASQQENSNNMAIFSGLIEQKNSDIVNGGNKYELPERLMRNPLVVMMGIDDENKTSEKSISKDLKSIFQLFHVKLHFDLIYATQKKGLQIARFDKNGDKKIHGIGKKLHWVEEDVYHFNDEIRDMLNKDRIKKEHNYDGLIYFIMCNQGSEENMIYLSEEDEEFCLSLLFDWFDISKCKYLLGKPKFFLINCKRGEKDGAVNGINEINGAINDSKENSNDDHDRGLDAGPESTAADDDKKLKEDEIGGRGKINDMIWSDVLYRKESDFRYIWASPDGYKNNQIINKQEENKKGSWFVRSFIASFRNLFDKEQEKNGASMDKIIHEMKRKLLKFAQSKGQIAPVIEDNSRMPYFVKIQTSGI